MIYLRLYYAFFKIGLLGFGGGMAIISMIYDNIRQFVAVTPAQYADIVAIAQVTPGPVAVNTATYVGYESGGILGAAVATLGVATPAFILIAIVANMVSRYKESRVIQGALAGIRPATVGMVLAAAVTIGLPTVLPETFLGANLGFALKGPGDTDILTLAITLLTVLLIRKFKINTFKVLIIMGCIGALLGVK